MPNANPFGRELTLLRLAVGGALNPRALIWQAAGLGVAAFVLTFAGWLGEWLGKGVAAFMLSGAGFVAAYVILAMTGCVVVRVLHTSAEGTGEDAAGVGPLHFLLDHLSAAALVPLTFAGAAAVLAGLASIVVALWMWPALQWILVLPSPIFFAVVFALIVFLFLLLFTIPVIVVLERLPQRDAAERVMAMLRERPLVVARIFAVGLVGAALAAVPLGLVLEVTRHTCALLYANACQTALMSGVDLVLELFKALLFWAPLLAVPFAFLNALALAAYDDLLGEGAPVEESGGEAEPEEPREEIGLNLEVRPEPGPVPAPRPDLSDE